MLKFIKNRPSRLIGFVKNRIATSISHGSLTIENMNPNIKHLQYAVRGPIVIKAVELEKRLKDGERLPFPDVIKCNIGDCHAMGQQPLTFLRQVVALACLPDLMKDHRIPEDAKDRARKVLQSCGGGSVGAYSQSTGVESVREDVAAFISRRDGLPCIPENVFLSTGASEAVKVVLQMMATQRQDRGRAGVMVPIPQYPLYSATNAEYDLHQIGYFLDEAADWGLQEEELERALADSRPHCSPRAIVVINPGNPTGQVLPPSTITMVLKFAQRHNLLVLADEVYQFNVYGGRTFLSFRRALEDLGDEYKHVQLASFMSCSKGFMGECGFRGGYCELANLPTEVRDQLYKCLSARLCSSVPAQALLSATVNPPRPGEPSHELFEAEKAAVLGDLATKGRLIRDGLASLPGVSCNEVQGAMYAFPRLELPPAAVLQAQKHKVEPDFMYCSELLESTGVCVVPGSGFAQRPGTYHFRTTILPPVETMKVVLERIQTFHTAFMKKYA